MARVQHTGEYGGRVIRPFKGGGNAFIADATLTPEMVEGWPLVNRIALHNEGKVEWFGPPSQEEVVARESGAPAPSRKRGTPAPKKKEEAAPAEQAASPRSRRRTT